MSKIKVTSMRTRGVSGKVKAYFTVSLGPMEIEDMKLIDGMNGLFIAFPSRKVSKQGEADKYFDVVRLTRAGNGKLSKSAQELYDEIFEAAKKEYGRREEGVTVDASSGDEDDELPF